LVWVEVGSLAFQAAFAATFVAQPYFVTLLKEHLRLA
jgi:hypothetical protein